VLAMLLSAHSGVTDGAIACPDPENRIKNPGLYPVLLFLLP
jgi:hypothetical protein